MAIENVTKLTGEAGYPPSQPETDALRREHCWWIVYVRHARSALMTFPPVYLGTYGSFLEDSADDIRRVAASWLGDCQASLYLLRAISKSNP